MKNGTLPHSEDLETFAKVIDEGGINGASRALRVPKSTISRRVGRLEEELGVRLFHRNHLKLELTEAGNRLLRLARVVLEDLETVVLAAAEIQALPRGPLKVSAPLDLASSAPLWHGFSEAYMEIALEVNFSNRYVDVVREGYDLALRGGRGEDATLVSRPLGHYELVAVATPEYIERFGALESPNQLREHSCVLLAPFKTPSPRVPHPPHRHLFFNDLHLVREGVQKGLGIAVLQPSFVAEELASGRLVVALEAYNPLRVPLFAAYPERPYLRPTVQAFLDYAEQFFSKGGQSTRL